MYAKRLRKVEDAARLVIGFDPSLAGFGAAALYDGNLWDMDGWTSVKKWHKAANLAYFKMPPGNDEVQKQNRLNHILQWVHRYLDRVIGMAGGITPYVAIEGYAFSQRSRGMSDLVELGGNVRQMLWAKMIPYRPIDPTSLKLATTGNGSADKEEMIAAVSDRFEIDLSSRYGPAADNIADALALAMLLDLELDVKEGLYDLRELSERHRKVLLRTTKAEPDALISRSLVEWSTELPVPLLSS